MFLKVNGTNKEVFFKIVLKLQQKFLKGYKGRFTSTNTSVVDNNHVKHVVNKLENVDM